MSTLPKIDLPAKLAPIFRPARYKVLHGGRGGSKSWSVARALLVMAASRKLRILCCREFQNSIKDSVHKLLSDQIEALGLASFYVIQQTSIVGRNGSEFSFEGLRHNATKIKSYEGVDIAWVEQGERVTKASWDILIPTVRKEGSEIWVTLNPELEEDESYQRFIVRPPTDAVVIEVSWRDNPWFPAVLRQDMQDMQVRDPDGWLNIWEGKCRYALEGAIYATELRAATEEGRIGRVPPAPGVPVHTAWDLGHSDQCAIWFFQRVGFEYRILDFYQNNAQKVSHYLKVLQERDYVYGRHYLPHDANNETMVGTSVASEVGCGGRIVVVVPRTDNVATDINVVRNIFGLCWFDAEKCADGLGCLRHYRYGVDEATGRRSRLPLHDWASDGADAFRTFAVGFQPDKSKRETPRVRTMQAGSESYAWLGT